MSHKRQLLVFLFFCVVAPLVFAGGIREVPLSPGAESVLKSLYAVRNEALMGNTKSFPSMAAFAAHYTEKLREAALPIGGIPSEAERTFLHAVEVFDMFQVYEASGERDTAAAEIEEAHRLIQTAVDKYKLENSEAFRVYGDIDSRSLSYKGSGLGTVALAMHAKQMYDRALQLNGRNGLAYIGLATWYLFAPTIGGGDAHETLKLSASAREYGGPYARYLSYVWSSLAYAKLLDTSKAEDAVTQGLTLVPRDPLLLSIRKKLVEGESPLSVVNEGA